MPLPRHWPACRWAAFLDLTLMASALACSHVMGEVQLEAGQDHVGSRCRSFLGHSLLASLCFHNDNSVPPWLWPAHTEAETLHEAY